jgi:hypothetical protein
MQSSEIGKLAEALSKAQGEMTHASKDAENPAFKRGNQASKYADLSNIIEAIRPTFAKHGLSYVQAMKTSSECAVIVTTLMHSSGEWIDSEISIPVAAKTPHGYGSAFTYARRYSLAAMAGITQADDDGNAGSAKEERAAPVRMSESAMANQQAAIEGADTLEALKSVWVEAVKAVGDDQEALRFLTGVKDAMKKKLSA